MPTPLLDPGTAREMRALRLALLGLLGVGLAVVALSAAASAADPPGLDVGMDPQVVLLVDIRSDFTVMEAGSALPMRVVVVDQHGVPVPGASVVVSADGARVDPTFGETDADGVFRFTVLADEASATRQSSVSATVSLAGAATGGDRFDLTVAAVPVDARPIPQAGAASVGVGAIAAAAFLSTEFGRYGAFKAIVFPLYSRLKKEEVLDHFVRGQIYGYIVSHPGQHYNLMRQDLRVTNGTLAHHLRTLEMMGFIKSARDGIFKRFYPVEMMIPQAKGVKLSDLQIRIMEFVRRGAGPSQADIAEHLTVTQQTVSYNLRALSREGAVRIEKDGRNLRYYPPAA